MKPQVHDIGHVINQIKRASPPTDKEMHKLLNNLQILLTKNTEKKESPLELALSNTVEQMNEVFVDLCFLRKEIVKKFGNLYFETISNALAELRSKNQELQQYDEPEECLVSWNFTTVNPSTDIASSIFNKLNKAKMIIEDSINKCDYVSKEADTVVDSYFTSL